MTKPNRALKVIDKNSLPKIIDILEIPKAKSSKTLNEVSTSEVNGENAGSIPTRPRKRRRKPLALSKTPKISNLGGNKNITTRRGLLGKHSRPPMPNSIGSATKKRKGFGGSVLTPYGMQMARLKSRSGGITPSLSKSPNLKKHYDRLKPIACNLYNQHTKQPQEVGRYKNLLGRISGRNNHDQKTTINSTPSIKRTPHTADKETISKENTHELKSVNPNENKIQSNSDDMDCDSSDELSLNSSSSSSPSSPSNKTEPSPSPSLSNGEQQRDSSPKQDQFEQRSEHQHQNLKESGHDEPNAKSFPSFDDDATIHLSVSVSPLNVNSDKAQGKILEGSQQEFISTHTNDSNHIEDIKVFNLVMGNDESAVHNELLGTTIGGSRFYWNNIDEDSVLTSVSSIGDKKSTAIPSARTNERVVLQTPNGALQHTGSSPPIEQDQNNHQALSPQQHHQSNELPEEESIEAWSIDGHKSSPFFFDIGGKKYGHPALPPGWTMRISRGENRPVYSHPDHGRTWHCPIKLTPNMVYVKTSDGRFVKQTRSSLESLKTETNTPMCTHPRRDTPKTPPSARELLPFKSDNRHIVSQTNKMKDDNSPEFRQEDQDSTFELMKEISVLSAGLMKKSSSNLQKVDKVKTIHQNTSALSNYDVFSRAKTVQSDTKQKGLSSSEDSISKMLVSTTSQSTTSQHHEKETPSTMSALLQQYEQALGHYDNLAKESKSHSNSSKKNSTTNDEAKKLSPIMESKNSERIEAWFTPAEDIIQDNGFAQSTILRFGSKKKITQPLLKENENGSYQEKSNINKSSLEANQDSILSNSSQKSVKDSPIQYDDEWSPLAQPESTSESLQCTPESPLRHDYKSSSVFKIQKNQMESAGPEEKVKHNDYSGNLKKKDKIDSDLALETEAQLQSDDDTALSALVVDETKPMQKNLETRMSKENSRVHTDTESSGTLSTEPHSGLQDNATNHNCYSVANAPNVSTVTISVQAHRTKNKSPQLIDVGVSVPLRRKEEQFDENHPSVASDTVLSKTRVENHNLHDGVVNDDNSAKVGSHSGSGINTDEEESNLSGGRLHPSSVADPKSGGLQTELEDEQSVSDIASIERLEKEEDTNCSRENTPDKTDTSDDGFVHDVEIHDGEILSNGPVDLLADGDSDTTRSIPQQTEPYGSPTIDRNMRGRNSTSLVSSRASTTLRRSIEEDISSAGTESAIESPVRPIILDQHDSHGFPDIENSDSSIESPVAPTKFVSKQNSSRNLNPSSFIPRKQSGMSWRVLHPPHPLCSLQRLEELISLEKKRKKSRAKRPKRGGRTQRKKMSAAKRRKSKGVVRT